MHGAGNLQRVRRGHGRPTRARLGRRHLHRASNLQALWNHSRSPGGTHPRRVDRCRTGFVQQGRNGNDHMHGLRRADDANHPHNGAHPRRHGHRTGALSELRNGHPSEYAGKAGAALHRVRRAHQFHRDPADRRSRLPRRSRRRARSSPTIRRHATPTALTAASPPSPTCRSGHAGRQSVRAARQQGQRLQLHRLCRLHGKRWGPSNSRDDYITLWGTLNGLETYTTIFGASVTIPSFVALYIG